MKKCPFCSENIQDEANKCRFCGEWLDKKERVYPKQPASNLMDGKDVKHIIYVALGWIFGVLFLISFIAGIVSVKPIQAIICFVMATVILPPVSKYVDEKAHVKLSVKTKAIILITGIVSMGIIGSVSSIKETRERKDRVAARISQQEEQQRQSTNIPPVVNEQKQAPVSFTQFNAEICNSPTRAGKLLIQQRNTDIVTPADGVKIVVLGEEVINQREMFSVMNASNNFKFKVEKKYVCKTQEPQVATGDVGKEIADKPDAVAISVSSTQLWNAYQQNEVAADNKYKGKKLAVTGSISGIKKDVLDDVYITFSSPNPFLGVMASLHSSLEGQSASFRKGQKITLLCSGSGMVLGSPMLSDCVMSGAKK